LNQKQTLGPIAEGGAVNKET